MKVLLTTLLLVAATQVALAGTHELKLDDVRAQQLQIREGVTAGSGRYSSMSPDAKQQLLSRQARLLTIIGDKTDAAELTEEQQREASSILAWEDAAINKTASEALVCTRVRATGSNFTKQVCKTRAQMETDHQESQRLMQETRQQRSAP